MREHHGHLVGCHYTYCNDSRAKSVISLTAQQALDENDLSQYYETISIHTESSNTNAGKQRTSDSITKIYACATMWHETRSEMMDMLKSIYR